MIDTVIELRNIRNRLGQRWVHDNLDLTIRRGEIIALIGASGCGKTTLLKTILMLRKATSGSLKLFGTDVASASNSDLERIRSKWGVMFQTGALFSSMTVLENILYPLTSAVKLKKDVLCSIARIKLELVGLHQDVADKFPSELSGGMVKRVAMARAIALDPELIFLDEPTAGLDPESASELDSLVLQLKSLFGLTVVMVTHDLDSLFTVPDRVVFLGEGKVIAAEPMRSLCNIKHPLIEQYFSDERARARINAERGY